VYYEIGYMASTCAYTERRTPLQIGMKM